MFYFIFYVASEIASQAGYMCMYYSVSGTYHLVKYVYKWNTPILPEPINYCPYEEKCSLLNENEYEVLITEESALYDIQKLLKNNNDTK